MTPCPVCATLADREDAYQKFGWPENDVFLLPAVGQLDVARDFRPGSERKRQLLRCPRCGTAYLYETDYEYLAPGTEDEQHLTRLNAAQAAEFLREPPAGAGG